MSETQAASDSVDAAVRRHSGWFSHYRDGAEDGWDGPHKHIEDACAAMVETDEWGYGMPIYVRRGKRLTNAQREEMGVEYRYECEGPSIIIYLPNKAITNKGSENDA